MSSPPAFRRVYRWSTVRRTTDSDARAITRALRSDPEEWLPGRILMDGESRFTTRFHVLGVVPVVADVTITGVVVEPDVVARGVDLAFPRSPLGDLLGRLHGDLVARSEGGSVRLAFQAGWHNPSGPLRRLCGRPLIGYVAGSFIRGVLRRLVAVGEAPTRSYTSHREA